MSDGSQWYTDKEFGDAAWEIHKERGGGYFPTQLVYDRIHAMRQRRRLPPPVAPRATMPAPVAPVRPLPPPVRPKQ